MYAPTNTAEEQHSSFQHMSTNERHPVVSVVEVQQYSDLHIGKQKPPEQTLDGVRLTILYRFFDCESIFVLFAKRARGVNSEKQNRQHRLLAVVHRASILAHASVQICSI